MNTSDPAENRIFDLRTTGGTGITDGQIEQMNSTIEQEQPKLNVGSDNMSSQ